MAADQSSHLVLARKWRPDRFGELVGQEHVTRTLSQALKSGRISHAFLFTGIRGVGKTTAARILARCLNCERGPTAEPCGECAACVEIRAGRALDVVEIDGATYRKIDDARAIIENLSYRPARDRFKIYIIDEAHQLTDQAFNALLKTLEEPPPHVKFILATTEPQKMPETILSRLQRYDFRRIPFATILARLGELISREGSKAEGGALALIAREAGGSMRDAERMLETAIALSSGEVSESEVASTLGVASRSRVYKLAESILGKDAAAGLQTVRELHAQGANLEALGRDLLETLRNLAVAKLPESGGPSPFADLPDQETAEIRRLAALASLRDLMRLFRLMAQGQEEILRSPYPELLLEMAVVRMATLAPVIEAEELLRAINGTSVATSGGSNPAPGGSTPSGARRLKVDGDVKADAPRRAAPPASATALAPAAPATSDLPELREAIRARKAPLAGFMEQGAALELDQSVLRIRLRNDIYMRYLSDNRSVIGEIAGEVYGRKITVEFIGLGSARNTGALSEASATAAPANSNGPAREASTGALTAAFDAAKKESNGSDQASAATPTQRDETRQALFADPVVKSILDQLQGRLVDMQTRFKRGAETAVPGGPETGAPEEPETEEQPED